MASEFPTRVRDHMLWFLVMSIRVVRKGIRVARNVVSRCIPRNLMRQVTLANHRANARAVWPEASGLDHIALALWGAFLRFHTPALRFVWTRAHHMRRWRRVHPVDGTNRKVLHVTGSFDLGGTQTQIKNLCTHQSGAFEHRPIEMFPEYNYLFRRGATVDAEKYMGHGLLGRTAGRLVSRPNYRSSQLVQIYKLVRDLSRERPAVVVGWGHEMCAIVFVAAAIARVPHVVFCIRTFNPAYGWVPGYFGQMLLGAHSKMRPLVSATIVNSTLLQGDHARWLGSDPGSIAVCANGIAVPSLTPEEQQAARRRTRAAYGIPEDVTVMINVGRFSAEKGQPSLVEANRLLLEAQPARQFVWLLCGDGPTMSEVQCAAAALDMRNMIFLGRTHSVRDFLCASDIFVMPSDFEGMPNAMMEAMATGLPCVSTTQSGALDVARDGQEALYYKGRDATHLARHLDYLMSNPEEARALGARAQARIKEFSVPRFVDAFEAVLDFGDVNCRVDHAATSGSLANVGPRRGL